MEAATAQLETHRAALTGHCYRMLGSLFEADDAVQETMVRAWKSLEAFDGRASMKTWLTRIATNVCIDALASRSRRARPMEERHEGTIHDSLGELPRTHWLEPIPDAAALPAGADPAEQLALRQSIRLAFVAALQHLPPRQRAALLLTEVVGWSVAEVAEALDTTVASINSALQRARATLAERDVRAPDGELTADQAALVAQYVDAFQRYDIDALTGLLRSDAVLSMPPFALWLRGPDTIRAWMLGRGSGCRGSLLVPTRASGLPAFAQYRPKEGGGHAAWALIVLELDGPRIVGLNNFLDVKALFPRFDLPLER